MSRARTAAATARPAPVCSVRLIDRRTGAAHRINGAPLTLYSRSPHEAAAELLEGRDPSVWGVRIEPLGPEARQ
ncbi:hypothetical protein [Frigidibacter mobilis]|uniref:Uncharacterized protein n=1 Tax=Frigidibacter mobilis TaxID=1335048 RepID=A0A159Z4M8_9RHOB|nr:hypothetical protein [Frigidibacter mobilis]AMY70141.1 hypothetical protein AKL17_2905 [Frigidibacter mobilis]